MICRERLRAALLEPRTAAEQPVVRIVALCGELIERHGSWLPAYR
jgi:alpha-galactosidase/6-phospho-beta-glucosidase family protein